jgi:GT2 family glycosyltransferase
VSAPTVVLPNWNGARWLPACLGSLCAQTLPPAEIIVVDNGSSDGSLELLRERWPQVRVLELGRNTGFAFAANRGLEAAGTDEVALVNTDVELAPDWLERMVGALASDPAASSVACKMLDLRRRELLYDAGDILRRDGVCEQRGRLCRDDGRYDESGHVFAACAGAALYRRAAVLAIGGFDERFVIYLEDVDLGLRLQLAGWTCVYEPAVAFHASEGSSEGLSRPPTAWAQRNTILIVVKAFPLRWLPQVLYRQLAWAWHALRERRLGAHVRAGLAALPLLPAMVRDRRALARSAVIPVEVVVPSRPIRGPRAGGHRSAP